EDAETDEVRAHHQLPAGEPVDERPREDADRERRQQVGDQERRDPGGRMGPLVNVDLERDERQPRACPGADRREKEPPEDGLSAEEPSTAAGWTAAAHRSKGNTLGGPRTRVFSGRSQLDRAAEATRSSAEESSSCSSSVPTVTRIASGAPKPCVGLTITPSRRSRSKNGRESSPTSAKTKFATAGPTGSSPCSRRIASSLGRPAAFTSRRRASSSGESRLASAASCAGVVMSKARRTFPIAVTTFSGASP